MSKTEQILCIQEHWLNDYENSTIENLVPNYSAFVRCWDTNERITNFKARRGKGGVAVMWPNHWTHNIKRLDDGNERIIGIEVKGVDGTLFIFNVYMPTHESNSLSNYDKHLDILHTLLVKYSALGTVIVCGDMNGTLSTERNNRHDCSLKQFVVEHNLYWNESDMERKSTFISHTGCGRSQIDYIMCTASGILKTTEVEDKHYLNQSAHTVVNSVLKLQLKGQIKTENKNIKSKQRIKMNWDKVDIVKYQSVISDKLHKLQENHILNPGESLKRVGECLKEAANIAVPHRKVNLNGPSFKASPVVKDLLKECKHSHAVWKENGSPAKEMNCLKKEKLQKRIFRNNYGENII